MKKFYLPPQLNGIAPQKYVKPSSAMDNKPTESNTANSEYVTQSYSDKSILQNNNSAINNDMDKKVETVELSVEQALKEYYDYLKTQK